MRRAMITKIYFLTTSMLRLAHAQDRGSQPGTSQFLVPAQVFRQMVRQARQSQLFANVMCRQEKGT